MPDSLNIIKLKSASETGTFFITGYIVILKKNIPINYTNTLAGTTLHRAFIELLNKDNC
jgi:hypothetical protein